MKSINKEVFGEESMLAYGAQLAKTLSKVSVIHLHGDLGMGKTTLVRGVLQGLGYTGAVKSPTYTLVEPYEIAGQTIYHFDLYRLTDPEELEYMGIRDYFDKGSVSLIEWPEKGDGFLPEVDVKISIEMVHHGRKVLIEAMSANGKVALESFL